MYICNRCPTKQGDPTKETHNSNDIYVQMNDMVILLEKGDAVV